MRRRFAGRLYAIVAAGTAGGDAAVIEPGDLPLLGRMAGVACGLRADVIGRLAFRAHRIVAIGTNSWRALEGSAFMAGCACNGCVRSGQGETCAEMVKVGSGKPVAPEGGWRSDCKRQQQSQGRAKPLPEQNSSPFDIAIHAATGFSPLRNFSPFAAEMLSKRAINRV